MWSTKIAASFGAETTTHAFAASRRRVSMIASMFKLTLRDLFAVVTIVALALGWWLDHRRHADVISTNDRLRLDLSFLASILEERGQSVIFYQNGEVDYVEMGDGALRARYHAAE
jgi:hypothetical protein